ncbi:MAG: D-alanyl-D-alanine carboxypeptidase [Chloroflexota bacterium]|nr:D-alanyl-D-alanine carboxypeptidase [Chloroflexota bacterium]
MSWLSLTAFGPPGFNPSPSDSDRLTQTELQVVRGSAPPTIMARAAVLVDADTGRVLWSYNGRRRMPMASTTKMMTALLTVRYADPEEIVTIYPRDLVGGSRVGLRAGESVTVEQLLYGALVPSGNDAAVALADYIGRKYLGGVGDEGISAFVDAMNAQARRMGLRDTRFRNPNGFDAPGHYSTAVDLAKLGRAVMADPLLSDIVSTVRYKVVGYVASGQRRTELRHPVETTNELLGSYRGANGVKTGTTPRAGEVLVASAKRGNAKMIGVVLNSTNRFGDVRALFDWGFATYEWLPLSSRIFGPLVPPAADKLTFAAVERWNTDLTFATQSASGPVYWASTERLRAEPVPDLEP